MEYYSDAAEGMSMRSCEGISSMFGGPLGDVCPQVVAESGNITFSNTSCSHIMVYFGSTTRVRLYNRRSLRSGIWGDLMLAWTPSIGDIAESEYMKVMAFALRTALHWKMAEKLMLAQGVVRDEFYCVKFCARTHLEWTVRLQFGVLLHSSDVLPPFSYSLIFCCCS